MFARKLKLTLAGALGEAPVPKAWLDQFFLRDFTGPGAFDETLTAADGVLEVSFRVDAGEVKAQFEKWLRGRKMIPLETELRVEPLPPEVPQQDG